MHVLRRDGKHPEWLDRPGRRRLGAPQAARAANLVNTFFCLLDIYVLRLRLATAESTD